jgi:chitodextrinase
LVVHSRRNLMHDRPLMRRAFRTHLLLRSRVHITFARACATTLVAVLTTFLPPCAFSQATRTWAHVQTNANHVSARTNTLAFSGPTTAGNLIIVQVSWSSGSQFKSLSDGQGNLFFPIGREQYAASFDIRSRLYYAANIRGGADAVTSVVTGSPTHHELYIHEYSGIDSIAPLEAFSVRVGGGSTFSSGLLTTASAHALLYGMEIDAHSGIAVDGWTMRTTLNGNVAADADAASPGSYGFTGQTSGAYIAWLAAFKPALVAPPPDTTAPSVPIGLTAVGISTSQIALSWSPATDSNSDSNQLSYIIFRDGAAIATTTAGITTFQDAGLIPGTSYLYAVAASDPAGNTSSLSAAVQGTTQALSVPAISSFRATPGIIATGESATLTWTVSNATSVTIDNGVGDVSGLSSFVVSPATSTTYTLTVSDGSESTSAQTRVFVSTVSHTWSHVQTNAGNANGASTNTVAFGSPTAAGNLIVVQVTWSAGSTFSSLSDSQGNVFTMVGREQYAPSVGIRSRLYYAANIRGGIDAITSVITGSPTYHELYIHEYSGLDPIAPLEAFAVQVGNGSTFSSGLLTTTTAHALLYAFEIDEYVGVAGAGWTTRTTLNGNVAADANAASPGTYGFTGHTSGAYIAWLAAFKPAALEPPLDTTAPSVPTGLTATGNSTSQIALSWSSASDPENAPGQLSYNVFRDGSKIATTPIGITAFYDAGLNPGTSYWYAVSANDPASNTSALSPPVQGMTLPPGVAPSVPTELSANALSPSEVSLVWNASSGVAAPVLGYKVFRDGFEIADVAPTAYIDRGLLPSTSHTYTVSAYDALGNMSAQSQPAQTTLDGRGQIWQHVQSAANDSGAGSNTVDFSGATTRGNLIVVEVHWSDNSTFVSLTDSQGNMYLPVGDEQRSSLFGVKSRLFYAPNIKDGTDTITTVVTGSPNYHGLFIHEYSGLDSIAPLDNFSVIVAGAETLTSGTVTTTAAHDLLYGIEIDSSVGDAVSGWTLRSDATDVDAASAGTYVFTGRPGGGYIAWLVAFKQVPAP